MWQKDRPLQTVPSTLRCWKSQRGECKRHKERLGVPTRNCRNEGCRMQIDQSVMSGGAAHNKIRWITSLSIPLAALNLLVLLPWRQSKRPMSTWTQVIILWLQRRKPWTTTYDISKICWPQNWQDRKFAGHKIGRTDYVPLANLQLSKGWALIACRTGVIFCVF